MKKSASSRPRPAGVPEPVPGSRVGRIVKVEADGRVWVDYEGNHYGPLAARLGGAVRLRDLAAAAAGGEEVLLLFEAGDPQLPILVDTVHAGAGTEPGGWQVSLDGDRVHIAAGKEIVLSCGKASITLTRAGKVIIRGAYVLSRSSGVNRIRGASVQLN
jgi:hypothetical protein